jgi:hypothetical protein
MNEKTETIKKWFEKADHDLGTAQLTFLHIPEYRDAISFHCQQAVEKVFESVPDIQRHPGCQKSQLSLIT